MAKKLNSKPDSFIKINKTRIFIFLSVLMAVTVAVLLTARINQYNLKTNLQAEMTEILNSIHGNGHIVHNKIKDNGCETSSAIIGRFKKCYYIGNKFFKNTGQAQTDIQNIDKQLADRGYFGQRVGEQPPVLSGDSYESWLYTTSDNKAVRLKFYNPARDNLGKSYDLLEIPPVPLGQSEYIYGIQIATYYD